MSVSSVVDPVNETFPPWSVPPSVISPATMSEPLKLASPAAFTVIFFEVMVSVSLVFPKAIFPPAEKSPE